jgi:hypothetical protein
MPFTVPPPPPPPKNVAFVDPATGLRTKAFDDWIEALLIWLKKLAAAVP